MKDRQLGINKLSMDIFPTRRDTLKLLYAVKALL